MNYKIDLSEYSPKERAEKVKVIGDIIGDHSLDNAHIFSYKKLHVYIKKYITWGTCENYFLSDFREKISADDFIAKHRKTHWKDLIDWNVGDEYKFAAQNKRGHVWYCASSPILLGGYIKANAFEGLLFAGLYDFIDDGHIAERPQNHQVDTPKNYLQGTPIGEVRAITHCLTVEQMNELAKGAVKDPNYAMIERDNVAITPTVLGVDWAEGCEPNPITPRVEGKIQADKHSHDLAKAMDKSWNNYGTHRMGWDGGYN